MTDAPKIPQVRTHPAQGSPMQVLLAQPIVLFGPGGPTRGAFHMGIEIPLALLYLEAYLEQQGHRSRIFDLRLHDNAFDKLRHELEEFHPQVVGITAFEAEIKGAHEIARTVKEFDDSIITVIGGIHVSAIPEQTLQENPCLDFVVYGEGELTLAELVIALQTGKDLQAVHGLAFRNGGAVQITPPRKFVENLDVLPFPDRSSVMDKMYRPSAVTFNYLHLPTTGIIAGRGCPYDCYHCSKGAWGRSTRYRSAENIFQEMSQCVQQYGIRDFRFYDDILTLPSGPAKELCQLILDRGLKVSFTCYSRVNLITRELLQLLKRAGCFHIKYGIEFGTESSIQRTNRRTTLDQAREVVAMTKGIGIMVKGNFMMGIPSETVVDCEETIAFAKETSPDLVSFAPFYLFPGSRFHQEIVIDRKTGPEYDLIPKDVLIKLVSRAYREFYFRPSYPFQLLRLAISDPSRLGLTLRVLIEGCFTLLSFFVYRLLKRLRLIRSEAER